jgi:hypothetical protein
VPFLLLMRREEQYHIGMQFKFAEIQQQIPIGLTKKIEAKKICFKHLIFRQYTTYIATVA